MFRDCGHSSVVPSQKSVAALKQCCTDLLFIRLSDEPKIFAYLSSELLRINGLMGQTDVGILHATTMIPVDDR
jgi:hypothetical protein